MPPLSRHHFLLLIPTQNEARSVQSGPPASTQVVHPKRKLIAPTRLDLLPDLCLPKEAIRVYPQDEDSINETGILPEFVKQEQRTTSSGASIYVCVHEKCQSPPFFLQSPTGIYSHVHRKHIGVVLACPYCPSKVYWNTKGLKVHMETKHRDVPHYGQELAGGTPAMVEKVVKESITPQEEVEEEVPPTEDSSSNSNSSSHTSDSSKARQECQQLTEDQAAAIMTGATALRPDPHWSHWSNIHFPYSPQRARSSPDGITFRRIPLTHKLWPALLPSLWLPTSSLWKRMPFSVWRTCYPLNRCCPIIFQLLDHLPRRRPNQSHIFTQVELYSPVLLSSQNFWHLYWVEPHSPVVFQTVFNFGGGSRGKPGNPLGQQHRGRLPLCFYHVLIEESLWG